MNCVSLSPSRDRHPARSRRGTHTHVSDSHKRAISLLTYRRTGASFSFAHTHAHTQAKKKKNTPRSPVWRYMGHGVYKSTPEEHSTQSSSQSAIYLSHITQIQTNVTAMWPSFDKKQRKSFTLSHSLSISYKDIFSQSATYFVQDIVNV